MAGEISWLSLVIGHGPGALPIVLENELGTAKFTDDQVDLFDPHYTTKKSDSFNTRFQT